MGRTFKEKPDMRGRVRQHKPNIKKKRNIKNIKGSPNSYNVTDLDYFDEENYEKFSKKR